jgi:hypothetical protein
MVLRGNIGIGRYWFGVLPLYVGHLFKARDFEYLKQGKYISGDERGGFHVAKVNLPLPDPRLRLFIQGKVDWLEEGLLVPARKNKRGSIVVEGSSSRKRVVHNPILCHLSTGSLLRQVITKGHKCKHGGVVHRCPHKIMWCPM